MQPGLPMLSPVVMQRGECSRRPVSAIRFDDAVEALARAAVANCAPMLCVPRIPKIVESLGGRLKDSALSASARRRIKILDRRDTVWTAIRTYLEKPQRELRHAGISLADTGWSLYMLVLATRHGAQFYFNPISARDALDCLVVNSSVSNESAFRLAAIRGVFASFTQRLSLPGLFTVPTSGVNLRDRLEEILEDAYLAEASFLRRSLSLGANRAAIRRDLRLLLRTIARNVKWARGLVKVGEHTALVPGSLSGIVDALLPVVPVNDGLSPVALDDGRPVWMPLFRVEDDYYYWEYFQRAFDEEDGTVQTSAVSFVDLKR